jgi:hypothetical protein
MIFRCTIQSEGGRGGKEMGSWELALVVVKWLVAHIRDKSYFIWLLGETWRKTDLCASHKLMVVGWWRMEEISLILFSCKQDMGEKNRLTYLVVRRDVGEKNRSMCFVRAHGGWLIVHERDKTYLKPKVTN